MNVNLTLTLDEAKRLGDGLAFAINQAVETDTVPAAVVDVMQDALNRLDSQIEGALAY